MQKFVCEMLDSLNKPTVISHYIKKKMIAKMSKLILILYCF